MRIFIHRFTVGLLLSLASFQLSAQQAEKLKSVVKVTKPNDYYVEQHKLWKAVVEKDPANADAWVNYFMAGRYACLEGEDADQKWKRQTALVDEMEKHLPHSFEFNYIKWWHGGNDHEMLPYLLKAYELAPERSETYDNLATYYETVGNFAKRDEFLVKLYHSGDYSPGLLHYNYNMLIGLEPNAILITVCDNDTYPAWLLQAAKGVRKDVTILNGNLMGMDSYQAIMFKTLGVEPIEVDLRPDTDHKQAKEKWDNLSQNLVKHVAANTTNRPVYVVVHAKENITGPVKDQLYLTGLAYKWSDKRIDNIALLKRNLEHNYAMDYLRINLQQDDWQEMVKTINGNYIVPLVTLYEHYKTAQERDNAARIKALVYEVGKQSGQTEEVNKYFGQEVGLYLEPGLEPNRLHMFPNPTTGILNIAVGREGERGVVTVLDLSGRTVKTLEVNATGKNLYTVDLSDLNAGTYIVRKQTAEGTSDGKVTIVR